MRIVTRTLPCTCTCNYFYLFSQDDIKQSKKEWELSHLQQLREQEEKMVREEEEMEEAMSLTYDRPNLINKVVFRRNKNTGTWEVHVPNSQASQPKNSSSHTKHKSEKHLTPPSSYENRLCGAGPGGYATPTLSTRSGERPDDPDYSPCSSQDRRTRSSSRHSQAELSPGCNHAYSKRDVGGESPVIIGNSPDNDVMVLRSRTPTLTQSPVNNATCTSPLMKSPVKDIVRTDSKHCLRSGRL